MEQFKLRDEEDPVLMHKQCCSNNPSKLNATLPDSERKAPCGFGKTFYCLKPTVVHFQPIHRESN